MKEFKISPMLCSIIPRVPYCAGVTGSPPRTSMHFTSSLKGALLIHPGAGGRGAGGGEGEEDEEEEKYDEYEYEVDEEKVSRTFELSSSLPPTKNEKAAHTRISSKVEKRGREEDDEVDEMRSVTSLLDFTSRPSSSISALPRQLYASKNILHASKSDRNPPLSRLMLCEDEVVEEEKEVEVDEDAYLDSFIVDDDEEEDIEVEEGVELMTRTVKQDKSKKSILVVKEVEDEAEVGENEDDFNVNFSGNISFSNSLGEGNENTNSHLRVYSGMKSRNLGTGSVNSAGKSGEKSSKRNEEAGRGGRRLEEDEEEEEEDSYSRDFDVSR